MTTRKFIFVLILVSLTVFAWAQLAKASHVYHLCGWSPHYRCEGKSCVKIREDRGYGSAVCIGKGAESDWLFLTCKHNLYVRNGRDKYRDHFLGIGGKWEKATFVAKSPLTDLALFELSYGGDLDYLPIGERAPAKGEIVRLQGFPFSKWYDRPHKVKAFGQHVIWTHGPVGVGISGGACWHKGRLVGIVSASDRTTSLSIRLSAIRSFVEPFLSLKVAEGPTLVVPQIQPEPEPEPEVPIVVEPTPPAVSLEAFESLKSRLVALESKKDPPRENLSTEFDLLQGRITALEQQTLRLQIKNHRGRVLDPGKPYPISEGVIEVFIDTEILK